MTKSEFNTSKVFYSAQNWLIFFVLCAGSFYLTSVVMQSFFPDVKTSATLGVELREMSIQMFVILRPFMEIVIIVWISDFILRKSNIHISENLSSNAWTTKTIVILSLLFTFIIASLVLTQTAVYLKSVILVFFGIFIGANVDKIKSLFEDSKMKSYQSVLDASEQ